MEICCEDTQVRRKLGIGESVVLGRRREWGITDISVSRYHAMVTLQEKATIEIESAKSSVFLNKRTNKRIVEKRPGKRGKLANGDSVFLLKDSEEYKYEFRVKRLRVVANNSLTSFEESTSDMFGGIKFVFLSKFHVRQLKRKLIQNGGEIQDEIDELTDFALSDDVALVDAASVSSYPRLKIVKPEFVSDSIIQEQIVDYKRYFTKRPNSKIIRDIASASSICPATPKTGHAKIITPEEETSTMLFVPDLEHLPEGYDWIEDFDLDKSRETVEKLHGHWAPKRKSRPEKRESDVDSENEWSESNDFCDHICCSAQRACFIEEMKEIKEKYSKTGVDQYRRKAAANAIRVLQNLGFAIKTELEIKNLRLGKKTSDKLIEVLREGRVRRNVEMVNGHNHQVYKMFRNVWGAGDASVRKWISAGCTTLADVSKRPDLTATQAVGLKYYDDLRHRISRAEAAEILSLVKQVALKIIAKLLTISVTEAKSQVFCSALGSFVRGKADVGDVDVLISPPETDLNSSVILHSIVSELLDCNIVTPDCHPDRIKFEKSAAATWMGICSPILSLHRRIDIKVYSRQSLPFAINYFVGSADFVRSLRYWCNSPNEETLKLAKRYHPDANAFKLTDLGLFPVKQANGHSTDLTNSILCEKESDIFNAVGLKYVPPKMRIFVSDY